MGNLKIQYARAEPRGLRRRFAWIVITIAVVVVILIYLKPIVYPILTERIPLLRRQTACLNWIGPVGQVAYEEDAAEAISLSGGHQTGPEFNCILGVNNTITVYLSCPTVLYQMHGESGFAFIETANGTVFLHGRRAKSGEVRLVCVQIDEDFSSRSGGDRDAPILPSMKTFRVVVASVGSVRLAPKVLWRFGWTDPQLGENTPKPTRIFFGQPDPVDESKFSILFQTPTEKKLIQGQLLADDTIHLDIVAAPDPMTRKRPTTLETNVASPGN